MKETREFKEEAIARVIARLNGEDEKKEKLAYLCLYSTPPDYEEGKTAEFSFFKFDAAKQQLVDPPQPRIHVPCVDDVMVYNNPTFPPDLLLLVEFGCTVWNSKIYIVGGYTSGEYEDYPSQKVFIYDTVSNDWKTSVMKLQRSRQSMVVAVDDQIFVFGGCYPGLSKKVWSEFCHITNDTTSEWHYLPNSAPDYLRKHPPATHAVHQRDKQILFWCDNPRIYDQDCSNLVFSYNYHLNKWHQYEATAPICRGPYWSKKVVVIQDFIFWHHDQTIYAHDLTSDTTRPVYNIVHEPDTLGRHVFLVHLGKSRLGLFCWAAGTSIWYHTFLIRISYGTGPPTLHLVPDDDCTRYFDACYPFILHALEVPS